jgi:aminopeptidase-like protein
MMEILEERQPCLYRYYPDYYKHTQERQGFIIARDVEKSLFRVLDETQGVEINLPMENVSVTSEPFIFLQE